MSAYSDTQPRLMNFARVCSEMPSMFIPSLLTKRANLRSCLAGPSLLVQWRVLVPLISLTLTVVGAWQTGQVSGTVNVPEQALTAMTLGMILLALMTLSCVPDPPMPRRSHSLMLHNEARLTVVPSSSTGWKMATGEMVLAAHDHSISFRMVSADSSCHLKARPARVA